MHRILPIVALYACTAAPVPAPSAPSASGANERGSIYTTPDWTVTGGLSDRPFGESMTGGDFDGDGYADLVVGTTGTDDDVGRVYVFPGSPAGPAEAPAIELEGAVD